MNYYFKGVRSFIAVMADLGLMGIAKSPSNVSRSMKRLNAPNHPNRGRTEDPQRTITANLLVAKRERTPTMLSKRQHPLHGRKEQRAKARWERKPARWRHKTNRERDDRNVKMQRRKRKKVTMETAVVARFVTE
jgi:hypothetical protein